MPRSVLGERAVHLGNRLPWLLDALEFVEAMTLRACLWLLAQMSPAAASRLGAALMRRIGPLLPKSRHIARNLSFVAAATAANHGPGARATVADIWANVGHLLAEYPHFRAILADGVHVVAHPRARAILEAGGPAVFVSAHVGSLEVASATIARCGAPVSILYSPLSNVHLERAIQRYRAALGVEYLPRERALRAWFRARGRVSCGLATDQRVDDGELMPFFGVPALTAPTPARLAARFGIPLLPLRAVREAPARYRVEFAQPIDVASDDASVLAATHGLQQLFERWIAEHPQQWLCTKRRWPREAQPLAAPTGGAGGGPPG